MLTQTENDINMQSRALCRVHVCFIGERNAVDADGGVGRKVGGLYWTAICRMWYSFPLRCVHVYVCVCACPGDHHQSYTHLCTHFICMCAAHGTGRYFRRKLNAPPGFRWQIPEIDAGHALLRTHVCQRFGGRMHAEHTFRILLAPAAHTHTHSHRSLCAAILYMDRTKIDAKYPRSQTSHRCTSQLRGFFHPVSSMLCNAVAKSQIELIFETNTRNPPKKKPTQNVSVAHCKQFINASPPHTHTYIYMSVCLCVALVIYKPHFKVSPRRSPASGRQ